MIVVAGRDSADDLVTIQWDGAAWVSMAPAELTPILQAGMVYPFEMAWEASGGQLIIAYAQSGINYVRFRTWNGSGGWGGPSGDLSSLLVNAPQRGIRVFRDEASDAVSILALTAEVGAVSGGQLWSIQWDGGAISGSPQLLAGYVNDWTHRSMDASSGTLAYSAVAVAPSFRLNETDGAMWLSESAASGLGIGARWTVLRSGTTRDEKVLATLDAAGKLKVQVWTPGGWGNMVELASGLNSVIGYRPFDVAYERKTGRAIVFYATSSRPRFNIWDGSTWLFGTAGSLFPDIGQAGMPWWIKAKPSPHANSDQIVIAALDNTVPPILTAYTWNGTSVPAHTALVLETTAEASPAAAPIYEVFDIAWESLSGRAMVVWGDNNSPTYPTSGTDTPRARLFTPETETWGGELTLPDQDTFGGTAFDLRQIRLASDPTSNTIVAGVSYSRPSLSLNAWNGTDWAISGLSFTTNVANAALERNDYRAFDVAYEASGHQALAVFSAASNDSLLLRTFTRAGGWTLANTVGSNLLADPQIVQLVADTIDDNIYIVASQAQGRLYSVLWNGSSLFAPSLKFLGSVPLNEQYPRDGANNTSFVRHEPFMADWHRDILKPISTIQYPANLAHYQTLATLSGLSSDPAPNTSGVSVVNLQLSRNSDGLCWNGDDSSPSNWFACPVYFATSGLTPWTKAIATPANVWGNGVTYTLTSRATDRSGNVETAMPSVSFVIDTARPTGVIVYPKTIAGVDGYYRGFQLAALSGTAGDTSPGVVSSLLFNMKREENGIFQWWNSQEKVWQGSEVYYSTESCGLNCWRSTTGVWQSTYPAAAWSGGATYYLSLNVQDKAGNWHLTATTHTFVVDETTPTVTVSLPGIEEGVYRGFGQIRGLSADAFPLAFSSVSLRDFGTGSCWGGVAFNQDCPFWFDVGAAPSWSYAGFIAPGVYGNARMEVSARGQDAAGNFTRTATTRIFRIDTTTPTAGVVAPIAHSTRTTLTLISGTATDNSNGFLEGVKLRIFRPKDGLYWTGAGWGAAADIQANDTRDGNSSFADPTQTFSQDWSSSFIDANWAANKAGTASPWTADEISGSSFSIIVSARDRSRDASNALFPLEHDFASISSHTFYWDVVKPTTSITSPVDTGTLGPGATTFYGGMYDKHSGVNRVEYQLQRMSDGLYWLGGANWGGQPANWPDANLWPSSWTVTSPVFLVSDSGISYVLSTRACDNGGDTANTNCAAAAKLANVEMVFTVGINTVTFIVDAISPLSGVSVPSQSMLNLLPTISGTATDLSAIALTEVAIASSAGGSCAGGNPDGTCRWWSHAGLNWVAFATFTPTTVSGSPWSYTVPGVIGFVDGRDYQIIPRATDLVGNRAEGPRRTFTWDVSAPLGNITVPSSGTAVTSINAISGTATDLAPGLPNQAEIYIRRAGTSLYWDPNGVAGLANQFNPSGPAIWFLLADSASDGLWTYNSAPVPWINGLYYNISTRIRDFATNEAGQSTIGAPGIGSLPTPVFFDIDRPTATIVNLVNGSSVSVIASASGRASDTGTGVNGGRVTNVYLHLYRQGLNQTWRWDTATWVAGNQQASVGDPATQPNFWKEVSYVPDPVDPSSGTWSQSLAFLAGLSGESFRIVSRAKDWTGSMQVTPSTVTLKLDAYQASPERPSASVTAPVDGLHTLSTFSFVTGTALDNTGGQLAGVRVSLRRFSGGTNYWTGLAWSAVEPNPWPNAAATDGLFNLTSEGWTFTMPPLAEWTDNTAYDLRSQAVDAAGNLSVITWSTRTFVYDTFIPTATITLPANLGFIAQTAFINGGATDTGAGVVNQVKVRVKRLSDNKHLDLSVGPTGDWVDGGPEVWNNATVSGAGPWTFVLSSAAWATGVAYNAQARGIDLATNAQVDYSSVTFSADFVKPSSVVEVPIHGTMPGSITVVSGTALDAGPAGINNVFVAYWRSTPANWWNKTTRLFDLPHADVPPDAPGLASNYWVKASTTNTPTVAWLATGASTPTFVSGLTYHVLSAADDRVQNTENRPAGAALGTSRISFIAPTAASVITKPTALTPHFRSALATLSGTANVESLGVSVRIKDITNAAAILTWNGVAWQAVGAFNSFIPATFSAPDWSYTVPQASWTSLNRYQIESQAQGTPTESPAQGPRDFFIDDGIPSAAITMPNVAYKRSMPALQGTAADGADGLAGASRAQYFRVRRIESGVIEFWNNVSTFTASAADCLTTLDATCLVPNVGALPANTYGYAHAKFADSSAFESGRAYTSFLIVKDAVGNAATVSKGFTLDVAPPGSGITAPSASPLRALSILTGTAADNFEVYATSFSAQSLLTGLCFNPDNNSFTLPCPYWVATSSDVSGANWNSAATSLNTAVLAYANTWYVLISKTIDTATNEQTAFPVGVSSRTVLFDNAAPNVALTFPVNLGKYKGAQVGGVAAPFAGDATDPNAPWNSGIRNEEIRVSYILASDTWYWQSTLFSSGTAVANSGYFSVTVVGPPWQSIVAPVWRPGIDTQYKVEARAEDASFLPNGTASGNVGVPATVGVDINSFIIDDTLPTVTLLNPNLTALNALTSIAGTANADLAGLSKVEVRIKRSDLWEWTGSSWTATVGIYSTAALSGVNGNISWAYSDLTGAFSNNSFAIYLRVTDLVGNVRTPPGAGDFTFTFDSQAPTLGVSFPLGPPQPPSYSNNIESTRISTYAWGTVSDPAPSPTGISTVWLAVSSGSAQDTWWSDATRSFGVSQPTIFWSTQVYISGNNWVYSPAEWATTAFADGVSYRVFVYASDKAGNVINYSVGLIPAASIASNPGQSSSFRYDTARPTSTVVVPVNGSFAALVNTFSGSAADPGVSLSGVKTVYAAVRHTAGAAGAIGWYNWSTGLFDAELADPPPLSPLSAAWTQVATTSLQGFSAVAWSTPVPSGMLVSGNSYRVVPAAFDWASNQQQNPAAADAGSAFTFDATNPTILITLPAASAAQNSLTMIAGTAADGAGLDSVAVRVFNQFEYWNNSAQIFDGIDANSAWYTSSATLTDWTVWNATFGFTNGIIYTVEARAKDKAGNFDAVTSTRTFLYDTVLPQSTVGLPANGAVINTLATVAGTASDVAGSGVNAVFMAIRRNSDNLWWNGVSAFAPATPASLTTTWLSPNWSRTGRPNSASDDLTSGTSYYITSRATDLATNAEAFYNVRGATFTFDDTAPLAGIVSPVDGSYRNSVPSFDGVSSDNVSVSTVRLSLRDAAGGLCYNPAANAFNLACPAWYGASGVPTSWTFAFPVQPWVHAAQYVLRSSATDIATNIQTALSSAAFTFDINAATAGITVPATAVLGPSLGNIAGTALDALAGISSVRLAISSGAALGNWYDGAVFTGGGPTFFTTSAYAIGVPDTWAWAYPVLADGQLYALRAQTLDKAGNQRDQDFNFRFDSSSPTATIAVPVNGGYRTGNFTITGAASDPDPDGAGPKAGTLVSTVAVSITRLGVNLCYDGAAFAAPCPNFIAAAGTPAAWTYTLTPNPYLTGNSYIVIARARDNSGNTQDVFAGGISSNTFTYNTAIPTLAITAPSSPRRRDLSTLAGTATDAIPASLASVSVRIVRQTGINLYANPAGGHPFDLDSVIDAENAWFTAASVSAPLWTNWTLSSAIPYVSGETYRIEARALNQAGTYSTTYSSATTIYDTEAPTTDVLLPVAFSTVSALPLITGTAFDLPLAAPGVVSNIRMRLTRLSDGQYWAGAGWTGTVTQLTTSDGLQVHQTSWTMTANLPPANNLPNGLQNGVSYFMTISGVDNAAPSGNTEAFNDPVKSAPFTVDLVGAVAVFTAPSANSVVASLAKIRGMATDAIAGVSAAGQIEIAIAETSPVGGCWNGTIAGGTFTLTGCPIYYPITGADRAGAYSSGSTFWEVNAPPLQNQFGYKIWVRARDNATPTGNYTAPATISSITFTYNTNFPSAAILIPPALPAPGGNLSAAFTVSGTASDNFGVTGASIAYQEPDSLMYWDPGSSTFSSTTPKWTGTTLDGTAPNYTFSSPAPVPAASSGRNYNLFVKAINNAGRELVQPAITVKWDTIKPVVSVTLPFNNSFGRLLPTITGLASDPGATPSSVGGTQVQIKRVVAGDCWSGGAWGVNCATESSWLTAVPGTSWTKNAQLPPPTNNSSGLEDGLAYEILARAFDLAANTHTATTANTFTFDVSSPAVANVLPLHGGRYSALTTISGTAADSAPGAFNVTFPRVRVYDIPLNQYWVDGTGWVTAAFDGFPDLWNTAIDSTSVSGVFTWRYNAAATGLAAAWPDRNGGLRVEAQAFDAAGNFTAASSTFSFDKTRPSSYVLYPPLDGVTYSTMAVIGGTATDNTSPITDVGIKMWYVTGPTTYYWSPAVPHWAPGDPGFFSIGGSAGPAATVNPWAYSFTQNPDFNNPGTLNYAWKEGTHDGVNGKLFHIITAARDGAGNAQTAVSTRTFRFDNVPPVSSPIAPLNDAAYKTLTTLSGSSTDDGGTVASVSVSIYDQFSAKYFDGSSFASNPEAWLPVLPANLFPSSWTFTNGSLTFVSQRHYIVKSSATDNTGNIQSAIGLSRFLYDEDTPNSSVVNPLNLTTYNDTKILIGNASDPNFIAPGITGKGAGVVPTLGWHQGAIEVAIFRDTAPLITGGPILAGGHDNTGYFWNGSTWVASVGLPVWVNGAFLDAFGNWQYDALTCPRPIPTDPCWVRGDPYVSWSRVTDNAGNLQSVIQSGPRFFISGIAQSFSVTTSSNPSTVGNDITVTVTARDGLGGAGGVASSYSGLVRFLMTDGTGGPETPDDDLVSDNLYGLPPDYTFTTGVGGNNGSRAFTIRMRKAGARLLRVQQTDNAALFGSINLTALRRVGVQVQLIADCDPLGQQPAAGVVVVGLEGRSGAPRSRTAGQTVNYCALVTDEFYNLDTSSTTTVYLTDADPNNSPLSPDQYLEIPNGAANFSRVFVTADAVGHIVTSTGSGLTPNASNPATPVVVLGQPADRLVALLPNEIRVQGKFAVAPFGKTFGAPDEVQAGSTISLRVFAVDPFYNNDASVSLSVAARIWTSSFTPGFTQTLQSGATTFVFTPVVAGIQSFMVQSAALPSATSVYYTPAPATVWWAPPVKLQLLAQGQPPAPGKTPFDANPTTGGRLLTVPANLTAGVTTTITLNLVDSYFNVVRGTTPFMTAVASVTMPLAQLDFLNDPNIQGRGLSPTPFQRTLNAGTTTFSFIPVTRSAGLQLRAIDTNLTGTYYSTDTVTNIPVDANLPVSLRVQMPGEAYAEGTLTGKTGAPSTFIAGDLYSVTLRAVDLYNNRVIDGRQVRLLSNDPYAVIPAPQALAWGRPCSSASSRARRREIS